MRKRELVFAAIIALALAAGDLFAFPMGLFLDIHIADIGPMYFTLMINQWVLIAAVLIVMRFVCPNWQLRLTKEGFGSGMKKYGLSGLLIFAISSIAFIVGLLPFDNEPTVFKVLIEGFIYYVGVAFIEELYIRGLLLNIIEKLFPKKSKATLYAVVLSSVIFGIGHIFGALGSSPLTIICKVVWTIGLGFYLGAIYKKTNNLWVPIILHAVIDFCAWPFCYSITPPYPEVSLWILLITYIAVGGYGFYIILNQSKGKKSMPFDYKKEYKEFYMPKNKPSIVEVPAMNYIAVRGKGDPNTEDGEYKASIGLLYGIAFTIKMSYKGDHKIDGYFEYVVPPLEGFWWQDGIEGIDYAHKENLEWISLIRLPDFVTKADFDWAVAEAAKKKKTDFSKVEFFTYNEGECVQCMHIGSYDDEPATIAAMHEYANQNGYEIDITDTRYHHEIYLSDARKVAPEKRKTVIRHPIRKV